jgi:hypothetical protein
VKEGVYHSATESPAFTKSGILAYVDQSAVINYLAFMAYSENKSALIYKRILKNPPSFNFIRFSER